jgi:hypothetical protein
MVGMLNDVAGNDVAFAKEKAVEQLTLEEAAWKEDDARNETTAAREALETAQARLAAATNAVDPTSSPDTGEAAVETDGDSVAPPTRSKFVGTQPDGDDVGDPCNASSPSCSNRHCVFCHDAPEQCDEDDCEQCAAGR